MDTILNIKSTLYRVVNVAGVTGIIGGKVYRSKAPDNSVLDDVEIIAGANVNDVVQAATLFVNYHVQNKADGQPDEAKMKTFADVLVPLIEANSALTIIDEQVYMNVDRPGWAYYSARVMVQVFNDSFTE